MYISRTFKCKKNGQLFKDKVKTKIRRILSLVRRKFIKFSFNFKEKFMSANYGIKRLQGMVKFMMSEDWTLTKSYLENNN